MTITEQKAFLRSYTGQAQAPLILRSAGRRLQRHCTPR